MINNKRCIICIIELFAFIVKEENLYFNNIKLGNIVTATYKTYANLQNTLWRVYKFFNSVKRVLKQSFVKYVLKMLGLVHSTFLEALNPN